MTLQVNDYDLWAVQMLFLDRQPIESWNDLIRVLPDKEFRKLTRSTIAHLDYWRDPSQRVSETGLLGRAAQPAATLHFEYQVASLDGATASHTDLAVISNEAVAGIEAKATEPMYDNVGTWLSKGRPNRLDVLQHWINLIGTEPTSQSDLEQCVYQMVHRLASLRSVSRTYQRLIYHEFAADQDHPNYVAPLSHLMRTFGLTRRISAAVIITPIEPTKHYEATARRLTKASDSDRPRVVRSGLVDAPYFVFAPPEIREI